MTVASDRPAIDTPIIESEDDVSRSLRNYVRDHTRLLQGFAQAISTLDEGGTLRETLEASWAHIVAGFGAHRAVALVPAPNNALTVLCATASLRPSHLEAVQLGLSTRGVSSSVVRRVIDTRRAERIENASLRRPVDQTAALKDSDYSVMCAPVLDASHSRVEAVLYLQSRGGSVHAYGEADMGLLEAFVRILEQLAHFQQKLESELIPAHMGYKEIRDHVLRRAIESRLKIFHYDHRKTMQSLKIHVPSTFYRIVQQLGIKSRQETIAELRAATAAAMVTAGADNGATS
jgi:hypothetical protein